MSEDIAAAWRPRRIERWPQGPGFPALLFGVILPVITIGFELATQVCTLMLFDPMPTLWHLLLVALVLASNYLVWSWLINDRPFRGLKKEAAVSGRKLVTWPGVLCGVLALIALGVPNSLTALWMKMAASPLS